MTCGICGQKGHNKLSHQRPESKKCARCGTLLPLNSFRTYNRNDREGSYLPYYTSFCIECDKAASSARYRRDFPARFGYLLNSIRHRCKESGMECRIDIQHLLQLLEQQHGRCHYTNLELSLETGDNAVSVERRNPNIGYVVGNVVLACWRANNMKHRLTETEFIEMCRRVVQTHG